MKCLCLFPDSCKCANCVLLAPEVGLSYYLLLHHGVLRRSKTVWEKYVICNESKIYSSHKHVRDLLCIQTLV